MNWSVVRFGAFVVPTVLTGALKETEFMVIRLPAVNLRSLRGGGTSHFFFPSAFGGASLPDLDFA